jgi:hypothetical protein
MCRAKSLRARKDPWLPQQHGALAGRAALGQRVHARVAEVQAQRRRAQHAEDGQRGGGQPAEADDQPGPGGPAPGGGGLAAQPRPVQPPGAAGVSSRRRRGRLNCLLGSGGRAVSGDASALTSAAGVAAPAGGADLVVGSLVGEQGVDLGGFGAGVASNTQNPRRHAYECGPKRPPCRRVHDTPRTEVLCTRMPNPASALQTTSDIDKPIAAFRRTWSAPYVTPESVGARGCDSPGPPDRLTNPMYYPGPRTVKQYSVGLFR